MDCSREQDMSCNWFENWFDSNYYHILYGNRNQVEAERFMNNLLSFLNPSPAARIHDLCCGKGRHSVFLNKKGFDVTGSDLSRHSIEYASQYENDSLSFFVNDMRAQMRVNYFDYVFNLFTSFGYFPREKDHEEVLKAVQVSLKTGGCFVLDFLNAEKLKNNLVPTETKEIDGIVFHLRKKLEGGYFKKEVAIEDKGKSYLFEESVRAFSREELETLFRKAGLTPQEVKGDYELNNFDVKTSDRLIIIARK